MFKNTKILTKLFYVGISTSVGLYANITGTVYKDFNNNGTYELSTTGIGDAPVIAANIKAVCDNGQTYTATTDTDGKYVLAVAAGAQCRVEADVSSLGVGDGYNTLGASPLVDVVKDGEVHDISTGSSATYCQVDPKVAMVAIPGFHDNGASGPAAFGSLYTAPTPPVGEFRGQKTIDANRVELTTQGQTGSIWGLAYKRSTKELFASKVIKRYVPLGSDGAGAIYKIDATTNAITLFATVPGVTDAAADNVLLDANRDYHNNRDIPIKALAGRQGLGDLDISEDETKLYTINLRTKELVEIDANSGAITKTTAIPNPYTNGECPASDVRPWGVKVRGTDVFIGSVCESGIENGVGASVQKYNGAIFQEIARTNTLHYLQPKTYNPKNPSNHVFDYKNWNPNGRNQPMLTDIEFTNNGDLVLGYTNRGAFNRLTSLNGDIRKMCLNPDGSYTDESTGVAPTTCATHTVTYTGNTEVYHEFYIGDYFGKNYGEGHPETASGAVAQAPGAPNIVVGMVDATNWNEPGAIGLYSNTTGDKIGAQALIKNGRVANGGEREPYAGKSGGMGDVELLCDPAPIEVGNYVWVDLNQDGIQDPNEPPMANVPVKLYDNAGNLLGTATTDANGHYYFGGPNNANLTAGNAITPNTAYELRIAQADVNGKAPSVKDANANADDIRDNDAVAVGTDNVITFTTGVNNDHSLDFGILPSLGCVMGTLFQDNNGDGIQNGTDTVAPAGITVSVTDSVGNTQTAETDATGSFTLSGVLVGNVTLKVDTTDTDIPQGAVWSASTANLAVTEGTVAANTCALSNFPFTLPAPTAQDPKDVAVCANPTSLTWEGATVSSISAWTTPVVNTPQTFTTAGGATVDVTMQITNDANNQYFAGLSGTSAAFGQPYLTLYLGDQNAPGDGNYQNSDNAGCAAHGYDLTAGDAYTLEVTFSEPVVLDNWRIRDVDSGDDRAGVANWEWQDGIQATAEDANGNAVTVESKIGTAGAGLLVDANGVVHTDKNAYDAGGGDFATGVGTTPNATNGHIVLTSNFVPVKKLLIKHVAGPDIPCQTRSALAMAGLAVCKPLHIAGTLYNDKDGAKPAGQCATSNGIVDGTPMNSVEGAAMHACLVDVSNNKVIDTMALDANGAYLFDKYIKPNTNYKVLMTENNCTVGQAAPTALLPENWNYEGEVTDPTSAPATLDTTVDGVVTVAVASTSFDGIDFGINKTPEAKDYNRPEELNPNDTTALTFVTDGKTAPDFVSDSEASLVGVRILSVGGGTLYYAGNPIPANTLPIDIANPDVTLLKIDPSDGDAQPSFTYGAMDSACRISNVAAFKSSFTTLTIAGNLFLDNTRDNKVNGTPTPNSCDNNTSLYVSLVAADGNVLSSTTLAQDGSYAFHYGEGVRANSNYTVVLSKTEGTQGQPAPAATLPTGCANMDGENIESLTPNTTDGTPDGKIAVQVQQKDVNEVNFAITPTVKIGDLVWIEDDNDGDATTGNITPVVGTTVTAVCDGTTYTAVTDSNGKYQIEVPTNSKCTVSVPLPNNKTATAGSSDNAVPNDNSENNKSHDYKGTTVNVGTTDNLTLDFGFTDGYRLGTHFWIDSNANGIFDNNEKPIAGALIELFDANGTKLNQTTTDANGTYGFDVLAGSYKVKFNIPQSLKDEGYIFSPVKNNADDAVNANSAAQDGITKAVTVGPGFKTQELTLDAGVNCGCANAPIKANGGDALGLMSMLMMMFMTFATGLFFIRKEEQKA